VALEKEGKFAEANAIKADLLMDYRRAQGL
jgi:hypothetical protein